MTDPKDTTIDDTEGTQIDESQAEAVGMEESDEEEEVFSNHPERSDDPEDEDDDLDSGPYRATEEDSGETVADEAEGDPEGEDEPQSVKRPEVRMRPKTVDELLLDAVPQRARSAGDKLKLHLTGKTLISIRHSTDRYLLDWSGAEMLTSKVTSDEADCKITVSEADLMKISTGDLNPQILMLSHKVNVSGKADHAIYIFNLIAPHSSL